jgi:Lon-like ATP-dependent protease
VTAKIEAAAESGLKKVLIPKENIKDVVLEEKYVGNVEIIPVENLSDVLSHALVGGTKKEGLLRKLTAAVESAAIPAGVRPVPR